MRRSLTLLLLAGAGLLVAAGGASAQTTNYVTPPPLEEPPGVAASPYGARFIPGVGFRYIAPPGARVYGYTAYGPRVYGYRAYRRGCESRGWWDWDRCDRRDRRWW